MKNANGSNMAGLMMWSCPKCNLSKGDKFCGDIIQNNKIENRLFYNPVEIDYNDIFYRNELGGIDSDDPKGREMIKILKLYRPVHNLALLYERYEKLAVTLEQRQIEETDPERRLMLENAAGKVAMKCVKIGIAFRAVYKDKNADTGLQVKEKGGTNP